MVRLHSLNKQMPAVVSARERQVPPIDGSSMKRGDAGLPPKTGQWPTRSEYLPGEVVYPMIQPTRSTDAGSSGRRSR